ncbi:MAG: DinB family protein [Candidatus Lokiarchaeota archaeon]|nr:DinB family protein [Candidatus Lokiarchaeota archaeon]
MVRKTTKNELIELVKTIRLYGNRMLKGLKEDEVAWVPENTKGRSIESYLRHILNAESYWYNMIKDGSYEIFSKGIGFNDLVNSFKKHETTILTLIDNAEDDDFNLRTPEWEGDNYQKLKSRGTLAWKIYRTSMHAIHHFGQIAHIRFSLENPPTEKIDDYSDPWGYIWIGLFS